MTPLVILGGSSLGASVAAIANAMNCYRIVGALDDEPGDASASSERRDLPILGRTEDLARLIVRHDGLQAIIAIGDSSSRKGVHERVFRKNPAIAFATVVHPSATVMSPSLIEPGSIVFPGAVLSAGVVVGAFCLVNANATIGTRTRIGDFVSIAPGANIGSECAIGTGSFVGMGAAIAQRIEVGQNCRIGALSFVSSNVSDGMTALGIPAIAH